MTDAKATKRYDLEERTLKFAKDVSLSVKGLPRTLLNAEYSRQLVRASGSVGANYIEANEALSKKRFCDASENLEEGKQRKSLLAAIGVMRES